VLLRHHVRASSASPRVGLHQLLPVVGRRCSSSCSTAARGALITWVVGMLVALVVEAPRWYRFYRSAGADKASSAEGSAGPGGGSGADRRDTAVQHNDKAA
jgi:hypothetical protein